MKYERLTKTGGITYDELDYVDIMTIYDRLAELENKIENGTLIEFPCKVGDIIFTITPDEIEEWEVFGILYQDIGVFLKIFNQRTLVCRMQDVRQLYFTKSQAEAKLKEVRGE